MKRILLLRLSAVLVLFSLFSFTPVKNDKPVVRKAHRAAKAVKPAKFTCVADIAAPGGGNPISVVFGGGSITITWQSTGSPASYNYGGYGVVTPGNTFSNSISYGVGSGTSRFGVQCKCADGTVVGSTHGVLFSPSGYSIF